MKTEKKQTKQTKQTKKGLFKMILLTVTISLLFAALTTTLSVSAKNAKNDYAFDGVHITRESITVKVSGSYDLSLRKLNAGEGSAVWTSADPSVATVENGTVTGVKVGETTVTVTYGNYTDTVAVKVTDKDPAAEEYEHTAEILCGCGLRSIQIAFVHAIFDHNGSGIG